MFLYVSSFKSLRAGSQVFALLMLFLCVILHTMWSGKNFENINTRRWNVLLLSINVNVSITTFKHNLKTYLLHNTVELKYPR